MALKENQGVRSAQYIKEIEDGAVLATACPWKQCCFGTTFVFHDALGSIFNVGLLKAAVLINVSKNPSLRLATTTHHL